jgi:hypothetical protein
MADIRTLELKDFTGGLNTVDEEPDVLDNQAVTFQNVIPIENGGLKPRYGYTKYFSTSLSSALSTSARINGLFVYNQSTTSTFLIHLGTKLYKDNSGTSTTLLFSGLASSKTRGIEMNGYIYMLDGSGYIEYNGATASTVSGYIPTYYADKNPDGTGGGQIDELNYIQSAFKETFSGNATSTTFYMSFGSLTTGDNIVIVDNVTLTSGAATAGFSANYASGYFTLTTAATSGVGNVEITAAKPVLSATCITNCAICHTHGEGNDTNVYLSKNPSFPARVWWSDTVRGPVYYPATSYADVGVTNDKMMGMLSDGNTLLLMKYRSIHGMVGTPPNQSIFEIYKSEGLIASDSAQLVEGLPTFYSQKGIVQLLPRDNYYELVLISRDVNDQIGVVGDVFPQTTYTEAQTDIISSCVWNSKYHLVLSSTFFIYDPSLKQINGKKIIYPWMYWNSFTGARTLIYKDGYLYFDKFYGSNVSNIFKLSPGAYDDDGTAISTDYKSKIFTPDSQYIKNFNYLWIDFAAYQGYYFPIINIYFTINDVTVSKSYDLTDYNYSKDSYGLRVPIKLNGKSIQYRITASISTSNVGYSISNVKLDYIKNRMCT